MKHLSEYLKESIRDLQIKNYNNNTKISFLLRKIARK